VAYICKKEGLLIQGPVQYWGAVANLLYLSELTPRHVLQMAVLDGRGAVGRVIRHGWSKLPYIRYSRQRNAALSILPLESAHRVKRDQWQSNQGGWSICLLVFPPPKKKRLSYGFFSPSLLTMLKHPEDFDFFFIFFFAIPTYVFNRKSLWFCSRKKKVS
jgi:hypothetical protein